LARDVVAATSSAAAGRSPCRASAPHGLLLGPGSRSLSATAGCAGPASKQKGVHRADRVVFDRPFDIDRPVWRGYNEVMSLPGKSIPIIVEPVRLPRPVRQPDPAPDTPRPAPPATPPREPAPA
jgi:hypothetical protein